MLDLFHIPSNTDNTKIFYAAGGTNDWQTWEKPRNAKFIQIFCLGGGASGGSGYRGTATANRTGAGGGGSGGITRALYPAFLLPDTLYVQVGLGGASVAGSTTTSGSTGTSGGISYVSIASSTSSINILAQSSAVTASGGAAAGNLTINAGGVAATVWTTGSAPFTSLGILNLIAGVAGGVSTNASTFAITNIQALGSNIVTGGAGGGSTSNVTVGSYFATAGGSIVSASAILINNIPGGLTGSIIGAGNPGGSGYGSLSPFCGVGGAGGSGQASGSFTAGNGGDGWYGCGGGGGGTSVVTTGTGGNGGKGGDGLVIITTIF
jgi:hypothetical protein